MATREQLIEDFADHKLATGEKFERLINSMKVVQEPVADPAALGTSLSFIDSISQDADGKITATKKALDLANAHELNPFKGWYKTGDTLPTTGFDGAYLYFKDTSELTGQTTIYRWNGTTYADTGTVVDTSNVQTFETGQAVNGTGIKDLNGDNDPNAAGVLSAEAGKELNEKLYGSHDESTSEEIMLSAATTGQFNNPSAESGNAYVVGGNWRKGMIAPEAFAGIKSYEFLRVTQGENYGGVTFVKKEAPSESMTYQQLVEGEYLSAVHTSYENVVINLPANTTTDIAIPEDAYTAYFLYRRAADGSGVAGTYRKPTMVVGYGLKTAGDMEEIWDKIREIEEGGDGGSEEPIDGADILNGTVGGEKLRHSTEEYLSYSLIDYASLVNGTRIDTTGEVVTGAGTNYRATDFIKLNGKKVWWYGMGSYGSTINGGALYDENKNVLRVFRPGQNTGGLGSFDPNDTEDPNHVEGAAYIRLTLTGSGTLYYCVYANADGSNPMAGVSGITTNAISYYRDQIINNIELGSGFVLPKEVVPAMMPAYSHVGANGCVVVAETLGANTALTIPSESYPDRLKMYHTLSFKASLTALGSGDSIRFGLNQGSSQGKTLLITQDNVSIERYDGQREAYFSNVTYAHGLTIAGDIVVEVNWTSRGGTMRIVTGGNVFVKSWDIDDYTQGSSNAQVNFGRAFVEATIAMTGVKLNQTSDRFMCPVWVMGDSYTSMSSARWTYQMINTFGIDGFLLAGKAGAESYQLADDLEKMLNYGTPKYLVWCLGMNDTPYVKWLVQARRVEMLCRDRGITLIYQTIPVPDNNNPSSQASKRSINEYIRNSGYRYIDGYAAVCIDDTPTWREGMCDYEDTANPGVHTTVLGATAMAGQVLVDFPEIANYK